MPEREWGSFMIGWLDRARDLRNSLVENPKFQKFAAAFPLTRPVARRNARAVFDLCAGFAYSQILFACVELGLFEMLRERAMTLGELAERMALPADRAQRLLDAAIALGLIERRSGERYGLGMNGAAILGNPGIGAMIAHHKMLYDDLRDPVSLLRGTAGPTALSAYWGYAKAKDPHALSPDDVAAYTRLMSQSQSLVSQEIIDGYPINKHRVVLDVGGGDGTFLRAVARRHPDLSLMLFDLPAVAHHARSRLAGEGLSERIRVHEGSFLDDSLPSGADLVTLVRIIHDHDDDKVKKLLAAVHRTLAPGGTVLIAEPMSGASGAETVGDAYFGFYLMAMGSGRPRSAETIIRMLGDAGFVRMRSMPTRIPLLTSLVVAETDCDDVNKA